MDIYMINIHVILAQRPSTLKFIGYAWMIDSHMKFKPSKSLFCYDMFTYEVQTIQVLIFGMR